MIGNASIRSWRLISEQRPDMDFTLRQSYLIQHLIGQRVRDEPAEKAPQSQPGGGIARGPGQASDSLDHVTRQGTIRAGRV